MLWPRASQALRSQSWLQTSARGRQPKSADVRANRVRANRADARARLNRATAIDLTVGFVIEARQVLQGVRDAAHVGLAYLDDELRRAVRAAVRVHVGEEALGIRVAAPAEEREGRAWGALRLVQVQLPLWARLALAAA